MNLDHLTQDEKNALQEFTNLYDSKNFHKALEVAENALEKFPGSKEIWHNQVGTLVFILHNDYRKACFHYIEAFKNGFDKETCEYNIWEAAEEFYKSLKKEDGTFNAIMDPTKAEFYTANHLIKEYINLFPEGQYMEQALKLNEVYESAKV